MSLSAEIIGQASRSWSETGAWSALPGGWVHLGGSFPDEGFSFEWHDFKVSQSFDWGRTFHPESVEVCFNLEGSGQIATEKATFEIPPESVAIYVNGARALSAERAAGGRHRFLTIECSRPFLRQHLHRGDAGLLPSLARVIAGRRLESALGDCVPMTARQRQMVASLVSPPVTKLAQRLWYRGKVIEFMAELFFTAPGEEFFCSRQKRVARERVDQVVAILRKDLENPPTLEQLGQVVGCSPYYLSRTFSQETGMTIPQFIRETRIDRAAELLLAGRHNVTEVALEVGYSSVSHFSQAFCQLKGSCPTLYPAQELARRKERPQ